VFFSEHTVLQLGIIGVLMMMVQVVRCASDMYTVTNNSRPNTLPCGTPDVKSVECWLALEFISGALKTRESRDTM